MADICCNGKNILNGGTQDEEKNNMFSDADNGIIINVLQSGKCVC